MLKSVRNNNFFVRKFGGQIELNRFAIISGVLLIVGCVGGIATYSGAMASTPQLITILVPTMACMATLLAVGPIKRILNLGVLALVVDIAIIGYNCLN